MADGRPNVGVAHGAWGEEVAAEFLRRKGYRVLARNVRPCRWDRRLEIDLIVRDGRGELLVFVEVKQHKAHSARESRLRSVDARKKALLRKACRAWLAKNRWRGSYRFDVIEIYGFPGMAGRAEIDHVERVRLFEDEERHVNWFE